MKSIHYVNSYAVRDRVDLSSYSSTAANSGHNVVPIESLLPDEDDRRYYPGKLCCISWTHTLRVVTRTS